MEIIKFYFFKCLKSKRGLIRSGTKVRFTFTTNQPLQLYFLTIKIINMKKLYFSFIVAQKMIAKSLARSDVTEN